ncbi:hypothetical protein V5O48_001074 [Marasmius crinis-equi]|uniref:DUF1479-domain-containing protein n=1 Tax=Marasmius crinis-equi TaxID=585013 RepID=A0ABR3FZV0_9AGAR
MLARSPLRSFSQFRTPLVRGITSSSRQAFAAAVDIKEKKEGDISSVFSSLGRKEDVFPERFAQLKREMWNEKLLDSWNEILAELETKTEEIASLGPKASFDDAPLWWETAIPRVSYAEIRDGLSPEQTKQIKEAGIVVVTGAVPKEGTWKKAVRDYAAANKPLVRGFPADNVQVYEFYNSVPQTRARTHPAVLDTQRFLLTLWHTSNPAADVSLDTPMSYFDRLRIRLPGDKMFTLGPHVDAGSVERWEDPTYRRCFKNILEGNWKAHDSYDVWPRINAKGDLYQAPSQCSIFRPWQGWLSISTTGPGEGTLRFLPALRLSTTYMMLRPFFKPTSNGKWEPDLDGPMFPGSGLGRCQEFTTDSHPHLKLDKTMVSMPRVEPGDQVYWHCDGIHSVEDEHRGEGDSSVMYIPAVPLTTYNAHYLRSQRKNFVAGRPAPDFPGGEGESKFVGRATVDDITTKFGKQAYGFEPFDATSPFVEKANAIIASA